VRPTGGKEASAGAGSKVKSWRMARPKTKAGEERPSPILPNAHNRAVRVEDRQGAVRRED